MDALATPYEGPQGGLLAAWVGFLFGLAGTFFPNLLAGAWLDEPEIVRWIAGSMLVVCGIVLADAYFNILEGLI